jgi:hypothetical protein
MRMLKNCNFHSARFRVLIGCSRTGSGRATPRSAEPVSPVRIDAPERDQPGHLRSTDKLPTDPRKIGQIPVEKSPLSPRKDSSCLELALSSLARAITPPLSKLLPVHGSVTSILSASDACLLTLGGSPGISIPAWRPRRQRDQPLPPRGIANGVPRSPTPFTELNRIHSFPETNWQPTHCFWRAGRELSQIFYRQAVDPRPQ